MNLSPNKYIQASIWLLLIVVSVFGMLGVVKAFFIFGNESTILYDVSYNIYKNGNIEYPLHGSDLSPNTSLFFLHPPVNYYVIAFFFYLFGDGINISLIWPMLIYFGAGLGFGSLLWFWRGARLGLIFFTLYFCSAYISKFATGIRPDFVVGVFSFTALATLSVQTSHRALAKDLALGFFSALAAASHWNGICLIAFVFVARAYQARETMPRSLIFMGVGATPIAAFMFLVYGGDTIKVAQDLLGIETTVGNATSAVIYHWFVAYPEAWLLASLSGVHVIFCLKEKSFDHVTKFSIIFILVYLLFFHFFILNKHIQYFSNFYISFIYLAARGAERLWHLSSSFVLPIAVSCLAIVFPASTASLEILESYNRGEITSLSEQQSDMSESFAYFIEENDTVYQSALAVIYNYKNIVGPYETPLRSRYRYYWQHKILTPDPALSFRKSEISKGDVLIFNITQWAWETYYWDDRIIYPEYCQTAVINNHALVNNPFQIYRRVSDAAKKEWKSKLAPGLYELGGAYILAWPPCLAPTGIAFEEWRAMTKPEKHLFIRKLFDSYPFYVNACASHSSKELVHQTVAVINMLYRDFFGFLAKHGQGRRDIASVLPVAFSFLQGDEFCPSTSIKQATLIDPLS